MIYIHFPFCRSFCTYCDFYSVTTKAEMSVYVEALLREMDTRKGFLCRAARESVPTLYLGGGTPSLADPSAVSQILDHIGQLSGQLSFEEFTLEVNPDDISEDYVSRMKDLGVNRVSMGVQSFSDRNLKWMNRRHDSAGALRAYDRIRRAGISNVSVDLIFGYDPLSDGQRRSAPEDLLRIWEEDLETAVSIAPEHISAYQMGIEEGSRLGRMMAAGKYCEPDEETCSVQYDLLRQRLRTAGYEHYEISNFARPGFRSVHNSAYWNRVPYIGLGPAAHSLDGNVRSWNVPDLAQYLRFYLDGEGSCSGSEELGEQEIYEEKVMLGLRQTAGTLLSRLDRADPAVLRELAAEGLVSISGDHIRIPEEKLFISDAVIRRLI